MSSAIRRATAVCNHVAAGAAGDGTTSGEKDLQLFYAATPNGWKISILLEELDVPYDVQFVDLAKGDQHKKEFLAVSPNNRMPALIDRSDRARKENGGEPIAVFESGAIMMYLARTQPGGARFLPTEADEPVARKEVEEWLFWQVSGLGPMAGQLSHFVRYAPLVSPETDHSYADSRYRGEYRRLLAVLDARIAETGEWLAAGRYTIADMACYGWVLASRAFGVDLDEFKNLRKWYEALKARPALRRGVNLGKKEEGQRSVTDRPVDKKDLDQLFRQDAATVKNRR
jgi:GSH-dependent disulfide-bond oxidoreductase